MTPNATKAKRTVRSRFAPQPDGGMRLEDRDRQLLCDLYLHRNMTRGQIEALFFTSTPRCNARLRQLFDHGFVGRYYLPAAPFGAQAIYSIGKAAVPVVARQLDTEITEVARQQRRGRTPTFIEHTLEIVNLWLAFRAAAKRGDEIEIERWLPEILCRHEYEMREIGSGRWRKEVFKPDGFMRLKRKANRSDIQRDGDNEYLNFFIEVDLGHTSARQFEGKLLAHRRYLESGLFDEIYGGGSFKTLVITTSERRLANLCELVRGHESDLFWFTTFGRWDDDSINSVVWTRYQCAARFNLCR